ncbi:vesicular glutamate transporter 3-like isoform X2 [Planococcus citri]|uniref:vesicular glutamate transporter 3-like isoform X2 n=1 Tax=Planococcus citri TaxID=170843 RepID=UPI0031F78C0C
MINLSKFLKSKRISKEVSRENTNEEHGKAPSPSPPESTEQVEISSSLWLSKRLLVIIVMFTCYVHTAFIRFNISIAVVEMTNAKKIETGNTTEIRPAEFDWDSKTVGVVLSIFYYGGLFSFLFGSVVGKIGGARSCALSMLLSGSLTMLQPLSLHYGFYTFLACRLINGLPESLAMVSILEVCSKWVPENEKSKLMSFTVNGLNVGAAVVHSLCAFLADRWGWPMIFYGTGALSITMSIICFILVKNRPTDDKWISEKEVAYIQQGIKGTSKGKVVHAYKRILLSLPVWAILSSRFTLMWISTILITNLPLYVKDLTQKSITQVGMMSSLPTAISIFVIPICGILMDFIKKSFKMSATTLYKTLISGAFLFNSALFLCSIALSNFTVSMVSFVLIMMSQSIINLSSQIVTISIAPNSSSVIAALGMFAFNLSSILSRSITGFMIKNHSVEEWNNCFILTSGVSLFGAIFFLLFGSSEVQSWAATPTKEPGESPSSNENRAEPS